MKQKIFCCAARKGEIGSADVEKSRLRRNRATATRSGVLSGVQKKDDVGPSNTPPGLPGRKKLNTHILTHLVWFCWTVEQSNPSPPAPTSQASGAQPAPLAQWQGSRDGKLHWALNFFFSCRGRMPSRCIIIRSSLSCNGLVHGTRSTASCSQACGLALFQLCHVFLCRIRGYYSLCLATATPFLAFALKLSLLWGQQPLSVWRFHEVGFLQWSSVSACEGRRVAANVFAQ